MTYECVCFVHEAMILYCEKRAALLNLGHKKKEQGLIALLFEQLRIFTTSKTNVFTFFVQLCIIATLLLIYLVLL